MFLDFELINVFIKWNSTIFINLLQHELEVTLNIENIAFDTISRFRSRQQGASNPIRMIMEVLKIGLLKILEQSSRF